MKRLTILASIAFAASILAHGDAHACGCFAPPDPSVPVVQAGERILFAIDNGVVTANIQIQYSGDASDFGWLLPLPSVPTLDLGVDELFNQITNTTQPKYEVTRVYDGNCAWLSAVGSGPNTPTATAGGTDNSGGDGSPLVIQSSIGPYDYAVLHADSQDDMLNWLSTNHYFVPAGTTDAIGPYIHPGAYFLALKLKSGASTGDLQPVVVTYASDLPMIPLVLTSVGAKPDMGIQVWMLGAGRAIPRNYYHTVLDDAVIDWLGAGENYEKVVVAATHEAPGRHTFVTEYAGSSSVMQNVLDYPGRFGDLSVLAAEPDPVSFVDYMSQNGYGTFSNTSGGGPISPGLTYSTQVLAVLAKYIPVPPGLVAEGVTPSQFYSEISYYLGQYETQNPQDFTGWTLDYEPAMIVADLQTVVITPTLAAGALFNQYPYLTRLYTTLSAGDMNKDPVFSYNDSLPDYSNVHGSTLTYHCGAFSDNQQTTPATLVTEHGFVIQYPRGTGTGSSSDFVPPSVPFSQQIQVLSEEGPPVVYADFTSQIDDGLGTNGCQIAVGGSHPFLGGMVLTFILGGALLVRRRAG